MEINNIKGIDVTCPKCGHISIKNGIRYLKGRSVQAYLCKNKKCGHRFYPKMEIPVWSMN